MSGSKTKCPFCAEMIDADAVKCPFCAEELPVAPVVQSAAVQPETSLAVAPPPVQSDHPPVAKAQLSLIHADDAEQKRCSYCAELIHRDAVKCRFCGERLDGSAPIPAVSPETTSSQGKIFLTIGSILLLISGVLFLKFMSDTNWSVKLFFDLLENPDAQSSLFGRFVGLSSLPSPLLIVIMFFVGFIAIIGGCHGQLRAKSPDERKRIRITFLIIFGIILIFQAVFHSCLTGRTPLPPGKNIFSR